MQEPDLEHLEDYLQWFVAVLQLRTSAAREETEVAEISTRLLSARAELARREGTHTLAANLLTTRLALSAMEAQVMWLLCALSVSPHARDHFEAAGFGDGATTDAIRAIVYGESINRKALFELGPEGKLRRLGIIERSDGGGPDVHESRQTWAISRRILALLHGDTSIDPALSGMVRIADEVKPVDELAFAKEAIEGAREAVRAEKAVVIASGMPGLGRRTLIAAAAKEAGIELLEIDAKKLAKDPIVFRKQLRMIVRECKLLARMPLVRNIDALVDEKDASRIDAIGSELASEIDGPMFVTCGAQRPAMRWDRPTVVVELAPPTSAQRAELWRAALDAGSIEDADFLATQYPLAPAMIHHAALAARSRATGRKLRPDDIYAGIRAAR
jgi:hypothetical protein